MRVNFSDFLLVQAQNSPTVILYFRTSGEPVFVKSYSEEWIKSVVDPMAWIESDVRNFCKQEGLELE
jgi:hypothetical protein